MCYPAGLLVGLRDLRESRWSSQTENRSKIIRFTNFSQPAENNQEPILAQLRQQLIEPQTVLEVGSGSGQHAARFSAELPHVIWQCCDQGAYFEGLKENLELMSASNLPPPCYLDLNNPVWPAPFDTLYAANVIHIISERLLPVLFQSPANTLLFYGPFKYDGRFTSESNERFDLWLKDRDPESGIRDISLLQDEARQHRYELVADSAMPANNQFLVFQR